MRTLTRKLQRLVAAIAVVVGVVSPAAAQTGTVMPAPKFVGLDNSGHVISGGKLCAFQAGTTTPQNTYTDSALATPNANPVILDSAGRATVYLTPGAYYKFILKTAGSDSTCNTGSTIWSQDNVLGVPAAAANVDITGTAGEAISAGQCVYLSDGSGSKTAGQWFKCDSTNTYSSVLPQVGMAPSAITSGASGTIRLSGSVTGLAALSVGSDYYASTAGAITSTAPTNARFLGRADTASSIVLAPETKPVTATAGLVLVGTGTTARPTFQGYLNSVCDVRLTLTSGTPVTTSDVTAATNVFADPYKGNKCALYDGSANWQVVSFTELTQALGTLTSGLPYDVFGTLSGSTMTTELLAWTNTTTRATALVLQDGVLVKTGATTRRYLGTFYTTSTTTTEDSLLKRDLFNYYNRLDRELLRLETTASWTHNSVTPHQANASASNQVEFVIGVSEEPVDATIDVSSQNPTATNAPVVGFGLDSTSAFAGNQTLATTFAVGNGGSRDGAHYVGLPGIGKHTLTWLEAVVNSGTAVTFVSNTNSIGGSTTGSSLQSGIVGRIRS